MYSRTDVVRYISHAMRPPLRAVDSVPLPDLLRTFGPRKSLSGSAGRRRKRGLAVSGV